MRKKQLLIVLAALAFGLTACGGSVAPMPGATFSGSIETGDKASRGTISFAISSDGASIVDLSLTLDEVRCDGLSAERVHDFLGRSLASIAEGRFAANLPAMGGEVNMYELSTTPSEFSAFASLDDISEIEGEFSSPTQASGTITIYVWVLLTDRACELGVFPWSAQAE